MPNCLLRLDSLTKSFGGVQALAGVNLELVEGEILGLVGENGAGKSTLIKLLAGVHAPESGTIEWRGTPARLNSPADALAAGIATIHQELEYVGRLSVAENMVLSESWPRHFWGGISWKKLHALARTRLNDFRLDISTHAPFASLSAAEKQEIAIAAALSRQARLLILDEPTASLSEPEVERLFCHLFRLRDQGVTIIYVSHRLDEIFRMTSRVAVLRDGRLTGVHATNSVTVSELVREMVGRPIEDVYPREHSRKLGEPLLQVAQLSRNGMFHDVTLSVRAGEILGLAGLVGAGRSELARAIYGLYSVDSGCMTLCGQTWTPRSPHEAVAAGLVYVPEERKRQGFVLDHRLGESISIGFTDLLSRAGLIDARRESRRLADILPRYDIRAAGVDQPVGMLSGGNQQKSLLARWLERDPRVIILDEPTRGVDVGAKAQIHALIGRLADEGKAVLLISSDLPEIVRMSDRVLVMNRGTVGAELSGSELTEHNVLLAASGLYPGQPTIHNQV